MIASTAELLAAAYQNGYAIGAFNIYNLEGAKAVVIAAEECQAPAIIQIHTAALKYGEEPLMALCLMAAKNARVPIAVHLDHSSDEAGIRRALSNGIVSIMADGSHLPYEENIAFTRKMAGLAHAQQGTIEAELGRLAGTEDGLSVPEIEARMTNPDQAVEFIRQTGVDTLAVCIGNIHGHYWREPELDFDRLKAINQAAGIPLVLHGASGLPADQVRRAIELGVSKLNVNTEVREAFVTAMEETLALSDRSPELLDIMQSGIAAMKAVIADKIEFFGSAGKASF